MAGIPTSSLQRDAASPFTATEMSKCYCQQDLKDHMRGAGGQVEYVKIMQDADGRSKVGSIPQSDTCEVVQSSC